MNKFYRIVLFAFSVQLLSLNLHAQKGFSIGLKGGIGIPNLVAQGDDPITNGYSSILGPYFGIVSEYKFSHLFSLQAELNYSSQGGQKNGEQAVPTGFPFQPYVYADFYAKVTGNYIELPILAKFTFPLNKKLSFFVNGGPYAGYLLAARAVSSGQGIVYYDRAETQPFSSSPVPFDKDLDIKDELHQFNFGIQGGMGLSLNMGKGNLFFNVGGNYGFITIQKDPSDGQNNTGAATFAVGYLLHLKRK